MTDYSLILTMGAVALIGLSIISLTALRGWAMWIGMRRQELEHRAAASTLNARSENSDDTQYAGNRIELADLRERVRKLEAIAAGVDL